MDDGDRRSRGGGLIPVMALVSLAGFVGLGGYLWMARRSTFVSSYIEVKPSSGATAANGDRLAANVIALLRSPKVAGTVLAEPGIANLPTVAGQPNATAWLDVRLQVKQVPNSPIIELLLADGNTFDDVKIMTAMLRAVQAELAAQPSGGDAIRVIQSPIATKR